jgi:YggT family protein
MYLYGPSPIARAVDTAFRIYQLILLVRILCSWFPVDRRSKWYWYLYRATEPVLAPFRQYLPPSGGVDFSPILAFIVLQILQEIVMRIVV